MIDREISIKIDNEEKTVLVGALIGIDHINYMEFGYPNEDDRESAKGYELEIIVKRTSTKATAYLIAQSPIRDTLLKDIRQFMGSQLPADLLERIVETLKLTE